MIDAIAAWASLHLGMFAAIYSALYGFVNGALLRLAFPLQAGLVYMALELALPHRRRNSLASYWRALCFSSSGLVVNMLLLDGVRAPFEARKMSPLVLLDLSPLTESPDLVLRLSGWIVAAFAVAFVGNFFYYWLHRAQHAVPLLWRFHEIHHSITEMSAANSYHHFTEEIFQFVVVTIPVSFLFGVEAGPVPWLVLTVASSHSVFIHSSANIDIGPLRYVIGDNRFHRIHHSIEARHFDRNFGTSTPLWDVLFGTACFLGLGEWPEVGLADVAEPKTLKDFFLRPFRRAGSAGAEPGADRRGQSVDDGWRQG